MNEPIIKLEELPELMKDFSINKILKNNAYQNKPLKFEDAYATGIFAIHSYNREIQKVLELDKELTEKQSIAALCSLHNQHTYKQPGAAEQIAGIIAAVYDYDILPSPNSFLQPDKEYVMDNCGMGGDLYKTPNVSTLAAIIAAADGVPFCKHGSPGNTDSVGSSDFINSLGVNTYAKKEAVQRGVEETNFGYTEALDTNYKGIHTQTHHAAHLAHMNDIIGPMTNPIDPQLMTKKIIGVNHLLEPRVIAEAYNILNNYGVTNVQEGMFVRGFADINRNGGMDEVSILAGGTKVAELRNGEIREYNLFAKDFGLKTATYEQIKPKGNKALFSREILNGKERGAAQDLILSNVAAIYLLANNTPLYEGTQKARETLMSGRPEQVIEKYKQIIGGTVQ